MNDEKPQLSTLWIGGLVGLAPAMLTLISQINVHPNSPRIPLSPLVPSAFFASISLWPLAAIILLFIPRAHRFGLGMLLGVGVGWLVMVCICGGMIK